ncbi:MAG TPA: MBOAT family O-acyltransferase [Gemmatimonadales bacterium]|nr:MBOAT family O-acyltransferase [Gemmatimonadales bacterium]
MLFNSYEFILGFLPVVALAFFLLGRTSRVWALRWLMLSSLFFYAWWRPLNVAIIVPAILINYGLALAILRANRGNDSRSARLFLVLGIVFNVAFLGYFKYANFAATVSNDVFGTDFVLSQIILPLGISFITFQKIAFLIDVHGRRIERISFEDFCLFVLFFPQLIAGPIVHYREMQPQFHRLTCAADRENLSVGLTLFLFGLFKKLFLADGIAPLVSSIYDQAAAAGTMSLLPAWMAAVGFTLQIYFDFSGYTDMALGSARIFGIRLPPNFDSPLRASSIIEFWSRWHMTLTRFLTAYVYNPLLLWLTRRRLARGRPGYGKKPTAGAFVELLVLPTLLTMFLSGVWHGAGYLFVVWGVLHGVFIVVNHAWRHAAPAWWTVRTAYTRPIGMAITLLCVVVSMVIFRAQSPAVATELIGGMFGLNGIALPEPIYRALRPLAPLLQQAGITSGLGFDLAFSRLAVWIVFLSAIALLMPNTLRLLRWHEPAVSWEPAPGDRSPAWQPSVAWAVIVAAVGAAGLSRLAAPSEFLYWQF